MEPTRNKEIHNTKEAATRGKIRKYQVTIKKNKTMNLNPTIKIITLNVNSLDMLLKTETVRLYTKATPNSKEYS